MRFIGTETEYGIATPDNPVLSPIISSSHAVVAFGVTEPCATGTRWDFAQEYPLRDQRGFDLRRYHTVPVIDPTAIGSANVILSNGGRFYVDHAHPEYSSPETTSAFSAMLYDLAGDRILLRSAQRVRDITAQGQSVLEHHDPCPELKFYKNNVDGKGASYGAHENYFYSRSVDFDVLAQGLIPFFVARQVITGAGRVGLGQYGEKPGFQISQRADYIEQEISLETTLNRGIINTRDEPHADAQRYGRLHVIIGDANMSHTSILLKLGMTSLVLDAIEQGVDFSDLKLVDAVAEVTNVSYDTKLNHKLQLCDGRRMTALELLGEYRARVPHTDQLVINTWDEVLSALKTGYRGAAHLLDWCAKLALIDSYQTRGSSIADPKLALIDLQYSDIDPEKGLYHALVRKQRIRTLATAQEINAAAWIPPQDTRARLRGYLAYEHARHIQAISWATVLVDVEKQSLARISMPELDDISFTPGAINSIVAELDSAGYIDWVLP
ncbi:depupylase/deamidase Dop [Corynebacterium kutscheri]|uniref:depupylase/deamidase Dop n=1 Tax=Corynebacterium kutscheri TaxID=35755 RepID=UPI0037C160AC